MNTADIQNLTRRYWQGEPTHNGTCVELVGIDEIAEMSDFTKRTLYVFSGRDDFPSPVARIKRLLLWNKQDIEHWLKTKA